MRNFILLHGGFHGAWCWQRLIKELEDRDARGFALDLPGHGDDPTPRTEVNRRSYIDAAQSFISGLQLESFTLVGHSLAGAILPDLAALFPSKVSEVVYVAALVLKPGESGIDLIPEDRRPSYFEMAESSGDNTLWMPFEKAYKLFLADFEESEARPFYSKLTPQPFQAFLDKAELLSFSCPVRYIVCDRDQALPPEECLSWVSKFEAKVQHIDSGHDVMLSNPGDLAELLLG